MLKILAAVMAFAAPVAAQTPPVHARQPRHAKPSPSTVSSGKDASNLSLNDRERVVQLLDRFTFGARPGDVNRVLAIGADKWLDSQFHPEAIRDVAVERRLADFPTLAMTPDQALATFPDRGAIQQMADGKRPVPADPLLAAMYEVQLARLRKEALTRITNSNGSPQVEASDAEKAAERQSGHFTAARVAGQLFALPGNQRMTALLQMPVEDRIALTTYLNGDQRTMLLANFSPREREIFLAMGPNIGSSYQIGQELAQAKMVRAILSERQLLEVMTDFWFNHFNVYIGKDSDQWYTTSYERDVIRRNALGKFSDLLLATAQSPAMMVYLDNWLSIGPGSPANGVNPKYPKSKAGNRGLNENYGREIMELHTLGVNGGYTQSDVTNLSAILTGWTVDRPNLAGPFQFEAKRHEPGTKIWLGRKVGTGPPFVVQGGSSPAASLASNAIAAPDDTGSSGADPKGALATMPGNDGIKEGLIALNLLAHSPQTAHFISWKIAQRFVADNPPPVLVDAMAKTFLASDGDIKAVLRTLINSSEFNSRTYFHNKVKTPLEFLASAYRTTMTDPSNPGALVQTIRNMGMPLYFALPPTGYYITADKWMNSSALVDRLNFAYQLTSGRFPNQKFDASKIIAFGLMGEQPSVVAFPTEGPLPGRAAIAKAAMTAQTNAPAISAAPAGTEMALRVLESTLIGGHISPQTDQLIHKQIAEAQEQHSDPGEMLNLLTALVIGSPEFQMR